MPGTCAWGRISGASGRRCVRPTWLDRSGSRAEPVLPASDSASGDGGSHLARLGFLFGLIPGVGAIYNGQYVKGLVHAVITGLLISLTTAAGDTAGEPFLAMLTMAFWFYMPFEAYHTAKKRQLGLPVEEWSSLLGPAPRSGRVPLGPIILIAIGIIFLLDTLHILAFREFGRFWPVILIVLGAYLLYSRVTAAPRIPPASYPSPSYPTPAAPPPNPADAMETRHEQ